MSGPSRRVRVLFVAPPGLGHLFPLVPLAWAFRSAGHDVRVATCGLSVNASARAGLGVVNVAPGVDLNALQQRHKAHFAHAYPPRPEEVAAGATTGVFADVCDVMADGVVDAARRWRADLIVYTPEAAAALIAATRLSTPAVFFSIGLAHTPGLMRERYSTMGRTFERHGVAELAPPAAWLDVSPPSLRPQGSDGWPMRYVQYNGGATLEVPGEASSRPRIAVTLGTVVPFVVGLTPLRALMEAAGDIDASFVVAYGASSARELGPLPPNVQAMSWIGLDALLPTCDAAIHHGGFGTALAILGAGLPQMLLPHGADQFCNAAILEKRGAALCPREAPIRDAVGVLLEDESLRRAAQEVCGEIAAMPAPPEVVPRLLRLVG